MHVEQPVFDRLWRASCGGIETLTNAERTSS